MGEVGSTGGMGARPDEARSSAALNVAEGRAVPEAEGGGDQVNVRPFVAAAAPLGEEVPWERTAIAITHQPSTFFPFERKRQAHTMIRGGGR